MGIKMMESGAVLFAFVVLLVGFDDGSKTPMPKELQFASVWSFLLGLALIVIGAIVAVWGI